MNIIWYTLILFLLEGCLAADSQPTHLYSGCSDPSAAAEVDERHFVVGDDEHNILKIYAIEGGFEPVFSLDLTDFLSVEPEHPETDIEAAAQMGDRIYWITSHGRNKDGKIRPSRYRFFATQIQKSVEPNNPNSHPRIVPVGKPCSTLINDILASSHLSHLKLQNVTRFQESLTKKEQELLAPKEKGLSIEGLAVGPDGYSLWIALRNPTYQDNSKRDKAIIIPLLNPAEVIDEGKPARFGGTVLLDLGGRGIRSIDYRYDRKEYWIAAGSAGTTNDFKVFRYNFQNSKLTTTNIDFPKDFTPEGLFILAGTNSIFFISDDGTIEKQVKSTLECMPGQLLPNGNCPNKYLVDLNKRTFRIFHMNTPSHS